MARNVLIIGANGFIGKHVVNEFLKNSQYNITAADLPGTFKQRYAFQTIEADITMPESLEEVIKKKDIIINVSGLVDLSADKKKLFDVNVNGVKNLCELCKRKDVEKLIHLSSIGVYGKVKNEAVTEYSRKRPKNNYEQSKYYGELVAFSYSNYFKVLAIRPAAVYGIGSLHKNVLPLFNMLKHKKIYSFKAGPRLSHVHVEDVARAVLFLAENKNAHGAYNLADDVPINTKELVSTLLEPLGLTVKPIIPYSKSLVLLLKYFAQSLPKKVYSFLNKRVQYKWLEFCRKNEILYGLNPRIDPVWLDYLVNDKVFSNEKIKSLGFKFKWPDPRPGLMEMVENYISQTLLFKL